MSNIRAEHNLQELSSDVIGTLILTNYKLVLKPVTVRRGNDPSENASDKRMTSMARVQSFFSITLGYLLTIAEVRPVTDGPRLLHSCIDVSTKDGRSLSFRVADFKKAITFRDNIRNVAFKENLAQLALEVKFNSYFARVHYDFVAKNFKRKDQEPVKIFRAQ